MNNRRVTYRKLYIGIIAVLTAVAAVSYAIELFTSRPLFSIPSFSVHYAVSFPFILLSIVCNCCVAMLVNSTGARKLNLFRKLIVEGVAVVLIAVFLVIIVNLPFITDMSGFIGTSVFWKSVTVAALINIFLLASAEFVIQTTVNHRLQRENALLQYQQLKSQINPHFLFNSLNVLVSLINKDGGTAVDYTKRLSYIYRYVLTHNEEDTVSVRQELEFIDNYICILTVRFGKGLRFGFDIRQPDLDKFIAPMSLQLLIENAVKHNAVSIETPLTVSIASDGERLTVSNNISPRLSCGDGTGTGLRNLSRKYAILSGKSIDVTDDGQTFSVKLPLL